MDGNQKFTRIDSIRLLGVNMLEDFRAPLYRSRSCPYLPSKPHLDHINPFLHQHTSRLIASAWRLKILLHGVNLGQGCCGYLSFSTFNDLISDYRQDESNRVPSGRVVECSKPSSDPQTYLFLGICSPLLMYIYFRFPQGYQMPTSIGRSYLRG